MAMTLGMKQFSSLLFASMGGAMTGLAAGVGAKNCFPETTAGGRVLAGIVIGALIGTVSAMIPAMLIYGNEPEASPSAMTGLRVQRLQLYRHQQ